jgi:hypothetical protein
MINETNKNKTDEQLERLNTSLQVTEAADGDTGVPVSQVIENIDRTVVQMLDEQQEERLISMTGLNEELAAAGIADDDILAIRRITDKFDYRDTFGHAYRAFKWAGYLVVVKMHSVESLVLPSDVQILVSLEAPVSYLKDGDAVFKLHIGTEADEMVKDASITQEMVKDASITKEGTEKTSPIFAAGEFKGGGLVKSAFTCIDYKRPAAA